jgi:hypothetical protein
MKTTVLIFGMSFLTHVLIVVLLYPDFWSESNTVFDYGSILYFMV